MKELQDSKVRETTIKELPAPQGIGMAVALDWGLAAQILLTPIIYTVFGKANPLNVPGLNPTLGNVLFFVIALLVACIPALFGEMIRSGRNWALWIQIVFNTLLSLAGIVSLVNVYQSVKAGNFLQLVPEVILVIISPLIVWRLSRPSTRIWFKNVTAAEARKRHGGRWVWFIALWAIVGGLLVIASTMR